MDKQNSELRPLMVTTAHRGVFFGYGVMSDASIITLKKARNCVAWTQGTRGFLGLASEGPGEGCKVGPAAPELLLRDVTSVALVTDVAAKRWEQAPW